MHHKYHAYIYILQRGHEELTRKGVGPIETILLRPMGYGHIRAYGVWI